MNLFAKLGQVEGFGDVGFLLSHPTVKELNQRLPPELVTRILRHLENKTGSAETVHEIACIGIEAVFFTKFHVDVVYRTLRRKDDIEGKPNFAQGIQYAIFRPFRSMMRALIVTTNGDVVMQMEYRRLQGKWMLMHCAGGTKKDSPLETLATEMLEETGCELSGSSTIYLLRKSISDDGVYADPLHYFAVDRVFPPPDAVRQRDDAKSAVREIQLIPFEDWKERALNGFYEDPFSENFAARCDFNPITGRLLVRGRPEILQEPLIEKP